MKMWKVNMKILIVTIISGTVSCKVATYNDNLASIYNNEVHSLGPPSSAPCTSCGSNPSISPNPYDNSLNYLGNEQGTQRKLLFPRTGNENERSGAVDPPSGKCRPELQLYLFGDPTDKSIIYFPKCTRIYRCNGCCDMNGRSCQPTNTNTTYFKVLTKSNTSGTDVNYEETIIPVDQHVNCECQCIVKQKSCTTNQIYDPVKCTCDCTNTAEYHQCSKKYKIKRWNLDDCTCVCRKKEQCPTGSGFDTNTCSCVQNFIPEHVQERNISDRRENNMNRDYINKFLYSSVNDRQRKHKDEP